MTTATAKRVTNASESYTHSIHGGRSLRYVLRRSGTHTVCLYYPAGEQDFPDCWNFETIEEAREQFRSLRALLVGKGYVRN